MANRGSGFFAFLLGVGVGTAVGILFAPDKGINTRQKLSYQLDLYRDKILKTLDDLVEEEISGGHSDAKNRSEKVVTDAKKKAEKLLDDVDQLINQIQTKEKKS